MSNSSDPITSLLLGMAAEWRLLALDIALLAECASESAPLTAATMVKLQAFDAMLQNIAAQAKLLESLARDGDARNLACLLEEHPVPGVRERLKASLGLAAATVEDDGSLHLFTAQP